MFNLFMKKINENEFEMDVKCPACSTHGKLKALKTYIPHFGHSIVFGFRCPKCNYKYSDILLVEQSKPKVIEYDIKPKDITNYLFMAPGCKITINDKYEYKLGPNSTGEINTIEGLVKEMIEKLSTHGYKKDLAELKEFLEKGGKLKIDCQLGISKMLKSSEYEPKK